MLKRRKKSLSEYSTGELVMFRFRKNKLAMFGVFLLAFVFLAVLAAPILSSYENVTKLHISDRFTSPNPLYIFGTDEFGRDLFARVLYGGRISLLCSFAIIGIAFVVGALIGGAAGFFGGKVGMDTGAMALGVILGPMIEENLGKSVDLSRSVDGGLMSVMFEGSINKVLIAALLLSLLTPFLLKLRNRKHAALLPEGPRPGWKTDLFAGIGFLAIAAAFLVQYEGLEGVSRVFPEVLTMLIGAGGAYFVGKGLWRRSREAAEPEGGEAVAWCKIGIICATSLCYAVLIPVFGFLVTTMGFIAGSTLILGDHSRGLPRLAQTAIVFAIGFSLLVWAGFTLLLNVPVPEGMFL